MMPVITSPTRACWLSATAKSLEKIYATPSLWRGLICACLDCENGPALAILEHNPPRIDGIELCRAIRRQAPEHQLPVLIVADREDQDAGAMAGVSDWLIEPFTAAYARTKIRTWLLRTARKSIKSATHAEEERPSHPLRVVHAAHGLGDHGIKSCRAFRREQQTETILSSAPRKQLCSGCMAGR